MNEYMVQNFLSRRTLLATAGATVASGGAIAAEPSAEMPPDGSNFGACPDDKVLNAAWQKFCQQLAAAGSHVFKKYNPANPLNRADGFRFLMQNAGQAFDMIYEAGDTQYPTIYTFSSPLHKIGGDNADQVEYQAWLDPGSVYKVSGNKGTVKWLNLIIMGKRPEMQVGTNVRSLMWPFGDPPEAQIFGKDLVTEWDGSFELYIGGPKRGPNWLPTTSNSARLYVRQCFDLWDEMPATLRIERVGMAGPRPVPTPQDMEKAMSKMGRFVTDLMNDWPDWPFESSQGVDPDHINKFPHARRAGVADPNHNPATDKIRGRSIINMTWKLAPDEALIMEFDKNDFFWEMTNYGTFFNSMDFQYRPVTYTSGRTKVDSDGKIRIVLAHDDPGYHNWMDTSGFEMGNIVNRNFYTDVFTDIRTRLVKRTELASAMPVDSAKVTREQRNQQMLDRLRAYQLRYPL